MDRALSEILACIQQGSQLACSLTRGALHLVSPWVRLRWGLAISQSTDVSMAVDDCKAMADH